MSDSEELNGGQAEGGKSKQGSGKQVLNRILAELSTKITPEEGLGEATDRLRAGLLMHGSTADQTFEDVSRLSWVSSHGVVRYRCESDGDDELGVVRQGIAVGGGTVFISDLFEAMMESPQLKQEMLKSHPELESADYDAGVFAIWLVVSSVQTFTGLLSVEIDSSRIDVGAWVDSMMKHYHHYFDHPELR